MSCQLKGYGPLTLIGEGRFSMVYKTQHVLSSHLYAAKVMSPNSKIPEPSVAFYREIQALSVASHPNIVKLHEVVQNTPSVSLVMEYLPYNLCQVVQATVIPESIAKGLMLMLLRGIAHLHELGIIHRDIKPANLLLSANGILKICDLGLCRILPEKLAGIGGAKTADETHAWTLQVGTSFYRAPELLLGDRGYGEAIDIWAVGCVFAELLTGKPLFPGLFKGNGLLIINHGVRTVTDLYIMEYTICGKLNVLCQQMVDPSALIADQLRIDQKAGAGNRAACSQDHPGIVQINALSEIPQGITC